MHSFFSSSFNALRSIPCMFLFFLWDPYTFSHCLKIFSFLYCCQLATVFSLFDKRHLHCYSLLFMCLICLNL
jgi:DNA phosphorothioation-dependent restriction protein DptG